jgi:hypothetical protein
MGTDDIRQEIQRLQESLRDAAPARQRRIVQEINILLLRIIEVAPLEAQWPILNPN